MITKLWRYAAVLSTTLIPMLVCAQWVQNGHDVMFTMYLPQAKKPDTNAIFIISYEIRWSCRPAVSVMLMAGRKLGSPQRQATDQKREDQLSIIIDGRTFTDETKVTLYSNAVELAMFAPSGLVEALKSQPKSVIARMGPGFGGFDFSDGTGFSRANAAAVANCS